MTARRRLVLPFLLLFDTVSIPSACGAGGDLQRFDYSEIVMGVKARIVLYARDEAAGRRAARRAFDRMAELDAVMSDYRPDSELVLACGQAHSGPVPISADLCAVLARALAVSAASDGAFDVTVGPYTALWRAARAERRLPDGGSLEAAADRVGWRHVLVDCGAGTLRLMRPDMRLDLGGIGKGYAADAALAELARHGVEHGLVDVGGDIAVGAAPPGTAGWRVAVDVGAGRPRTLTIAGSAVARSGDTEQFVEIDGVRFSHIVDPRTGLGLTNRAAVTVLAPDAATADALASAISVMGPARGLALLDGFPGTSAIVQTPLTGVVERGPDTGGAPPRRNRVLIVGIDGLRADALPAADTPNLDRLRDTGCFTDTARVGPVTVSGPGWSSLLTGVWMDKHGVTDNSFDGRSDRSPHFFARLKAKRPGAFTVSALDWLPLDVSLVEGAGADVRFACDYRDDGDEKVVEAVVAALAAHDPDVAFVYFADLDVAGHEHGFHPAAPGYVAELEQIDAQLGRILDAVRRRPAYGSEDWLVIVCSDHGGTIDGAHGRDEPLHRNVPLIISGPSAARGRLYTTANIVDVPATALAHLGVAVDPAWGFDGRPVGLAAPTAFDTNLIFNGDAEYGGGYDDAARDAGIGGWTDTGAMTVIRYGAPEGFPGPDDPGPPDRGACFFCGGTAPVSAIEQVIDVADVHDEVDAGLALFELSGWFGGYLAQRDLASLTAEFLDERDAVLRHAAIGPVTHGDRGDATGLRPREAAGTVPPGTRRIRVRLTAEAGTGDNDGYADNLALVLRRR
jgi:thiamine biosynthesis lipoprotein